MGSSISADINWGIRLDDEYGYPHSSLEPFMDESDDGLYDLELGEILGLGKRPDIMQDTDGYIEYGRVNSEKILVSFGYCGYLEYDNAPVILVVSRGVHTYNIITELEPMRIPTGYTKEAARQANVVLDHVGFTGDRTVKLYLTQTYG